MCRAVADLPLARDEGGATATIFALTLTVLTAMLGVAVDGTRWNSARQQHASAIDTALLAGARHLQLDPSDVTGAQTAAMSFYTRNAPAGPMIVNNSVAFMTADNGGAFTFNGTAYIRTTFLNVIGIQTLPITVPAKAVTAQSGAGQGSDLEIAVMLDVTGSMCDDGTGPCTAGGKIDGVKHAAVDLANIVLGQTSSVYTSRIALVPFSSAVRIGVDGSTDPLMQGLTNLPQSINFWGPSYTNCSGGGYVGEIWQGGSCTVTPTQFTNWQLIPCVTERSFDATTGFDPGDSVPGPGNWLLGHEGGRSLLSWDSTDTPMTTHTGQSAAQMSNTWNYSSDGSGCMSQPGNEVLPLTSSLTVVTNRINTLDAFGPTAGALGTVWAQYMLSPNWSGIWTGSQRPGSYADTQTRQASGAPVLRKVAVLMTDGGFNTVRQNAVNYATDGGAQMQNVSNYAVSVCTNMKANGIEIYTVGFNLNALSAPEQAIATATLQACGSDVSHFYRSLTVNELSAAFRDIALKMNPVRLSQ